MTLLKHVDISDPGPWATSIMMFQEPTLTPCQIVLVMFYCSACSLLHLLQKSNCWLIYWCPSVGKLPQSPQMYVFPVCRQQPCNKKHAEALLVLCLDWFFCNSNTTQQWHVSKKPSSRSVGGLYELIYRLFSFIHQLTAVACYPTQVEGWVLITSFLWHVFYG